MTMLALPAYSSRQYSRPRPSQAPPKPSSRDDWQNWSSWTLNSKENWIQNHEEVINGTQGVLQSNCGEAPVHLVQRSGKRGLPQESPCSPPKKIRLQDDKRELHKVEVSELRFSQLSCKDQFQCGRKVMDLAEDLLNEKVSLSAPFLRLTVFEETDRETKEPILRCIDNRRLLALKTYAGLSEQDSVMVNVNFFSQDTVREVERYKRNSDDTPGHDVHMRESLQWLRPLPRRPRRLRRLRRRLWSIGEHPLGIRFFFE